MASYHSWALAGVLLFASVFAAGFRSLQEAPWATRVPVAVLAAASLAFVGLFAGLGARGMPSRFMRYLDEFSLSQVAASVATFTILAGFAYYVVRFTLHGTAWSPLYGLRPESDDG